MNLCTGEKKTEPNWGEKKTIILAATRRKKEEPETRTSQPLGENKKNGSRCGQGGESLKEFPTYDGTRGQLGWEQTSPTNEKGAFWNGVSPRPGKDRILEKWGLAGGLI